MIAIPKAYPAPPTAWQDEFQALLPEIRQRLQSSFRGLAPEARAEAVAEAVVHCLLWYLRLHEQGRAHVATPSSLAYFAAKHVRSGRPAVGRLNAQDVLSRYAQVSRGLRVEAAAGTWIDELVADPRASVPDQVAAKLDVRAWWRTLTERVQQIAHDLAIGGTTAEVAARHGVSASRISQLRRALAESWAAFQHEPVTGSL